MLKSFSKRSAKTTPHPTQYTLGKWHSFSCFGSRTLILQMYLLFSFWMNALCKQIFPADFWGTIWCSGTFRCSCISAVRCHSRLCPCVVDSVTPHLGALSTFPWDWKLHFDCEPAPCSPFLRELAKDLQCGVVGWVLYCQNLIAATSES